MSAEEFRILLKSCQPDSLSIYPGTFLGNEPIEVPEKGAWMSCFSAKHLKRKQSLIVASHSVATNEKLAEILALDDSVVLTPVVFKSASISHRYYVPELEGHNLWVRSECEENRINLCKE